MVLHGGIVSKALGAETEKPRTGGTSKSDHDLLSVNLGYPAAGYVPRDYLVPPLPLKHFFV